MSKATRLTLVAIIAVTVALCWTGLADGPAFKWNTESLAHVGALYATARVINGLISLLQGTVLDLPMIEIALGELLDPANDLIERFSGVMTLVLGSLILQKALFEIVSRPEFNVLVTVLGAFSLIAITFDRLNALDAFLRIFLVSVFIRLSLALAFLLSQGVEVYFLDGRDGLQHDTLQIYQKNLRELNILFAKQAMAPKAGPDLMDTLGRLNEEKRLLSRKIESTETEIMLLKNQLIVEKRNRGFLDFSKTPEMARIQEEISRAANTLEEHEQQLAGTNTQIDAVFSQIQRQVPSGSMSKIDARAILSFSKWRELVDQQIGQIQSSTDELVNTAINLIVTTVLKYLILPLLFFYGLFAGCRAIWKYEYGLRVHP